MRKLRYDWRRRAISARRHEKFRTGGVERNLSADDEAFKAIVEAEFSPEKQFQRQARTWFTRLEWKNL